MALGSQRLDHRGEIQRMAIGAGFKRLQRGRISLSCPSKCICPIWVAELDAPHLGGRQGRLGAGRDGLTLLLRNQRKDPDGKVTRFGHVGGLEFNPAVLQMQEERSITAETIDLGNDEGRTRQLRMMERLREFRPVVPASALDLRIFSEKLAPAAAAKEIDTIPLGLKPKARLALGGC